jgi:hypothetical protein
MAAKPAPRFVPFTQPRPKTAKPKRDPKRWIDRSARVIDHYEARAQRFDALIEALQRRKQHALERMEKTENDVLTRMQQAGLEQLTGCEYTLSMRKNAAALQVIDQKRIPQEYLREKLIVEVDKIQVKAALPRGEDVPGVKLTQSVSLIRRR